MAFLIALFLALSMFQAPPPNFDDAATPRYIAGDVDYVRGDCFATMSDVDRRNPPISCDRPHRVEAYAIFDPGNGPWPGQRATEEFAEAGCASLFRRLIGNDQADSTLTIHFLTPDRAAWDTHDNVLCLVESRSDVKGTLERSRR